MIWRSKEEAALGAYQMKFKPSQRVNILDEQVTLGEIWLSITS